MRDIAFFETLAQGAANRLKRAIERVLYRILRRLDGRRCARCGERMAHDETWIPKLKGLCFPCVLTAVEWTARREARHA